MQFDIYVYDDDKKYKSMNILCNAKNSSCNAQNDDFVQCKCASYVLK